MAKGRIEVYNEACKSCLFCTTVCPKHVVETTDAVNSKGYKYIVAVRPEDCIGCAMCATICPEGAITVYREVKK